MGGRQEFGCAAKMAMNRCSRVATVAVPTHHPPPTTTHHVTEHNAFAKEAVLLFRHENTLAADPDMYT